MTVGRWWDGLPHAAEVWEAFLYSNGKTTDLGAGAAVGINDSGQVVVESGDQAFLYSNGTMTNLGTFPGGSYSEATAINASGQVVGWAETSSGYPDAFLYSDGTMTDLNSLLPANSGWDARRGHCHQ